MLVVSLMVSHIQNCDVTSAIDIHIHQEKPTVATLEQEISPKKMSTVNN